MIKRAHFSRGPGLLKNIEIYKCNSLMQQFTRDRMFSRLI